MIESELNISKTGINQLIIQGIQDVKGENIVMLDLRELHDRPCNFFIICQGNSSTQLSGIADRVTRLVRDEIGERPVHKEGKMGAQWVLLDYFNTVVHIFHPEARTFYDIEGLWQDAIRHDISTEDLANNE